MAQLANHEELSYRIQGDGDCSIDLIAVNARYHRTCYYSLRRNTKPNINTDKTTPTRQYSSAFDTLCNEIEEPLKAGKAMYLSTLTTTYKQHLIHEGVDSNDAYKYRNDKLKQRLTHHFGDSILFWPQEGNLSDLVCSSKLSAAQLISACITLKRHMAENFIPIPSSDDSEVEDSDDVPMTNKINSETELSNKLAYKVAQKIKSDLKSLKADENDDESWSVNYEQAEKIVPSSVYNLLAFILSDSLEFDDTYDSTGRVKLPDNRDTGTSRLTLHERVLNLAQNIIFARTGTRTPQHVSLAMYIYQKTRKKDIITVLSRLGLCISYNDLQRTLTSVALDV
ncbi:MAG: hypothetical protein ABW185_05300, partial [Sedimenticola sp.]